MKKKGGKMAAKQKVARPPIEEPSESEPELSEQELQMQLDLDDELQNNFVDEQHFQIGDMPEPESDNIRHSKSLPAPRRPLPPPPPPSKFQQKQVTKRERPVVGLKAITEQDLMQGAAKLRAVKRNFNPVKVGRKELFDDNSPAPGHDFFPLIDAQKVLGKVLSSGDVISLDLSGVDQLTDLFFKFLIDSKLTFPALTKVNCGGCVYLTDQCIKWMTTLFGGLQEMRFNGCRQLTEASLGTLINADMCLYTIEMMSTNVAIVPNIFEKMEVSVKLNGCPLVSPTYSDLMNVGQDYFTKVAMSSVSAYKLVIWRDASLPFSLGSYLVTGEQRDSPSPLSVFRNWMPQGMSDAGTRVNVFEVKGSTVALDMFVSRGSVCLLPYVLNDPQDETKMAELIQQLSVKVMTLVSKASNIVAVLAAVVSSSETAPPGLGTAVEKIASGVREKLREHSEKMTNVYQVFTRRPWIISGLDFADQNSVQRLLMAREAFEQTAKRSVMSALITVDTEKQQVWRFLKLAFARVNTDCLPLYQVFGPQFLKLTENLPQKAMQHFSTFCKESVPADLKDQMGESALHRAAEIMNLKGLCMFCPFITNQPIITDYEWLQECLALLSKPPQDGGPSRVTCVDEKCSHWTESSLVAVLNQFFGGDRMKALDIIVLLEKSSVILRLPCTRHSKDDEKFIYIPYDELPREPHITLEHLWSRDLPAGELQVDRYYTFVHGYTASFMAMFLRHCAKVNSFTLLWKLGALIQQGGVETLVELHTTNDGLPVLVLCVRTNKPVGQGDTTIECLWSQLNMFCAILDYCCKTANVFAEVTRVCETCEPTRNPKMVIAAGDDIQCYLIQVAKTGHDRSLMCKKRCAKRTFTKEELVGPDHLTITPSHGVVSTQAVLGHFERYTKCFQCGHCAESGMFCEGNGLLGSMARLCSCETDVCLCPLCGTCQKCIAYLAKLETTLRPGMSSACAFSFLQDGQDNRSNLQHGNVFSFNASAGRVVCLRNVLSPEKFNRFEVTLLRRNKMIVVLKCGGHDRMQYIIHKGVMFVNDTTENQPQQPEWVAKEGSTVAVKMSYVRDPRHPAKVTSATRVDILLNGEVIYSITEDKYIPLVPEIRVLSPVAFIVNTPTVLNERNYGRPTDSKLRPGLWLDYEDRPVEILNIDLKNNKITLKPVLSGSEEEEIECEVDSEQLHPLGYVPDSIDKIRNDPESSARFSPAVVAPWEGFTEGQRRGWKPDAAARESLFGHRCGPMLLSAQGLECSLAQCHSEIMARIYRQGIVNLTGAAVVSLPETISKTALSFPGLQTVVNDPRRRLHSLCYVRGDCGEILELPPTYEIDDRSAPYWQLHFLDAPGMLLPNGLVEQNQCLLLAWCYILSIHSKIDLPNWSQMFTLEKDTKASQEEICRWIHAIVRLQASAMLMSVGKHHFLSGISPAKLQPMAETVKEVVSRNLPNTGLVSHLTLLDLTETFICAGHLASRQCNLTEPQFPVADFHNYAPFIASLQFGNNRLETLPDDFFARFTNLVDIDLSENKLRTIPLGIGHCKKLSYIRIGQNKLTDLPSDLTDIDATLVKLDISSNAMRVLPPVILRLTRLKKLHAQHLLLTRLPENIGDLQCLEMLYLGGNCLSTLPASFRRLKRLTTLNLNGVAWMKSRQDAIVSRENFDEFLKAHNLSEWLESNRKGADELDSYFDAGTLDDKEVIGKLNAHLFAMFPRFGTDKSKTRDDGGIPRQIFSLSKLEHLSLQYQGFTSVPDAIRRLSSLHHVYLSNNPLLTNLSANFGSLPLKQLELTDCPSLKTPPREITTKGFQATHAFLKRLQTGSVTCKRTKLMLVGLGGAGKTSLVQSLMREEDHDGRPKSELEITDGIDITSWTVGDGNDSVTFSMWDFAGQTVYYNTHQFFLSNRAVYLLLWNIRLGHEHAGLDFWLSSISVHAPKAPIFVVGTHVDQVSKSELPVEEMRQRYPQIAGYHFVSCLSGQGVAELERHLLDVALKQPYMGERIPEVWLNFETAVIRRRAKESIIDYKELENMASESGIFEKSETVQAVQFLHELGALQHFTNAFLRDRVIIDPQWIVDVMACVVSVKDSPIKDGRFRHEDVAVVWADYEAELHDWLLRLTEEFDLTFPLADQAVNLVPCLLPETPPEFHWPELDRTSGNRETKMVYKFTYLPAGLFNRGQVRLYQFSDSSVIWKRGSLLHKNGHIALVRQTNDCELLVTVQGPRPENILFLVHEVFEGLISESFQGVTYDYMLPCPDCQKFYVKDPCMFAASTIRRASELHAPFLQCNKYFHAVTLTDLHSIMPPDNTQDYDRHLADAIRGLTDLRRDMSADIFISYCSKDIPTSKLSTSVDPRQIRDDLCKEGYRCYFADNPDEQSIEQMALAMRDADVFMALISDAYVADPQCMDVFLYARHTLRKPLLLVALGDGFEWRRSKLGLLVADEVFIKMQKLEQYRSKLDELTKRLADRTQNNQKPTDYPPCFISYSWGNSRKAVAKGTRRIDGALGFGDPREIREYLEEHGIRCWLDIDRVGRQGLFEDIAEGLRHARLMIACVSAEYARSDNCAMEFRFATSVLKIPTLLVIVGTDNSWRLSEVGLLSVQRPFPEINFQEQNDKAYQRLLKMANERLRGVDEEAEGKGHEGGQEADHLTNKQKSASFQELFELAQRKFLRQLSEYAEATGELYPRLIFIDCQQDAADSPDKENPDSFSPRPTSSRPRSAGLMDICLRGNNFAFKILCEHDQGWHSVADPIAAPQSVNEPSLRRWSPYLARITALVSQSARHDLLSSAVEDLASWLEQLPQAESCDFRKVYTEFRDQVMTADSERRMGQLARCYLPSGKTIWLCPEHQRMSRVTVLTDDVIMASEHIGAPDDGTENYMVREILEPDMDEWKAAYAQNWPAPPEDTSDVSSEEDDVEKRQLVLAPKPPAEERPPQQNRRKNHRGRHPRAASQSNAPVTATTKAVPAVVDLSNTANAGTGMSSQNNVTPERLPNITLSSGPREGQGSNSKVSEEELQLRLRLQTAGMRLLATAGGDKAVSAASCRIL